mmetsp:Transcript_6151/g.12328  ORF Transcript_6151/g.12328 Transcript_6151/m.12328 type:complete len:343 (+) Transcript_6151:86-1114(+)|eukprot:scaffold44881_cov176-Amphora_coffeaeformis.AAC.1
MIRCFGSYWYLTQKVGSNALSSSLVATVMRRTFASSSNAVVGFVGLGRMGLPMAKNLAKSTSSVVVAYDTNPTACAEATASNIQILDSVRAVGERQCDVLISMLPGDPAFDAVMTEWQEVFATADTAQTILNCSTVSPSTSKKWQETYHLVGGHTVIDAPVSGGVKGATDGTLTFMVGCQRMEDLDKVRPYLDVMGKQTFHCGPPGTGSATKLCNNLALATQMVGICEALSLGEELGVDPVVLASVMNTSTAKCWSSEVNNPHPSVAESMVNKPPAANGYVGGFATNLMLKDLTLALQAAREEKVTLPLTSTTKDLYHLCSIHGLGERDFGVIHSFLRGKSP